MTTYRNISISGTITRTSTHIITLKSAALHTMSFQVNCPPKNSFVQQVGIVGTRVRVRPRGGGGRRRMRKSPSEKKKEQKKATARRKRREGRKAKRRKKGRGQPTTKLPRPRRPSVRSRPSKGTGAKPWTPRTGPQSHSSSGHRQDTRTTHRHQTDVSLSPLSSHSLLPHLSHLQPVSSLSFAATHLTSFILFRFHLRSHPPPLTYLSLDLFLVPVPVTHDLKIVVRLRT